MNQPNEGKSVTSVKSGNHQRGPCSLVRFSAAQYERIKNDAINLGKSIPRLLRTAYFEGGVVSPIFSAADADRIMAALNRIGNNVNQIAKHLNSGFREGFEPLLEDVVTHLSAIRSTVVVGYERR